MRAQYNELLSRYSLPKQLDPLLGRTLVVVAHMDDETIACGGLMQFMREPCVVFATDGAPADEYFWKKHGSRDAYARMRQQEARSALQAVGVQNIRYLRESEMKPYEFADQQLYLALPRAFDEIYEFASAFKPEALLTLTYEGGHPDHDCAGFLASRVGRAVGVPVFEAPLYHRIDGQPHFQEWMHDSGNGIDLQIKDDVLVRKRVMISQYRSQFTTLHEGFRPELERFRPQVEYDYAQPPHPGKLNYEAWGWQVSAADVCHAFQEFDRKREAA
jgi:N-acetylglucosamine malate deacetylase 2